MLLYKAGRIHALTAALALTSMSAIPVQGQIPASNRPADDILPGLVWVQFHDAHLSRPAGSGVDRVVDLRCPEDINDSSRIWRGLLRLPRDKPVSLELEAQDGAELWLGDRLLIDGWCRTDTRSGMATGPVGSWQPIEIRFWHAGRRGSCRLLWSRDGHPRELVPPDALAHLPNDERLVAEIAAERQPVDRRLPDRSAIYQPGRSDAPQPIRLTQGVYLLLDDYLIERSENLHRRTNSPKRALDRPIVTGRSGGDNCFEPYVTVLRDPQTGRFRIWYGVPESAGQSHIATMESEDGINWQRPHRVLRDPSPIQFGVSVIDEGSAFASPGQRFKLGYYGLGAEGLRIAVSPDGLNWRPLADRTLVPHDHDINGIWYDPIRKHYVAILGSYTEGPRWSGRRRISLQTISHDLVNWERPWIVLTPNDALEHGKTEFYGLSALLVCGDLVVGMVKVLHDDFAAEADGPVAGVGWTSLAWSRDGVHWVRDREIFFDRNPEPGQWDRAMAWVDCQLPVGDEVYLYYGGYARGHKINRFEERQIGLVRIRRERYVARCAGDTPGLLRTPLVIIEGTELKLNVDATGGEIRGRVLDSQDQVVAGFDFDDCPPVRDDSLEAPLRWRHPLSILAGQPVRLELRLRNASLYALRVE